MVTLPDECSHAPRVRGAPQEPWFHPVPKSAHHPTVPCTSSRAWMLLAPAGHPSSFQTPLPAPGTAPCSASGQAPIFTTLLSQVCRLLDLAEQITCRETGVQSGSHPCLLSTEGASEAHCFFYPNLLSFPSWEATFQRAEHVFPCHSPASLLASPVFC